MPDIPVLDSLRELTRQVTRALDPAPEGVLLEIVVLREAWNPVVLRLQAQQPASTALARERAVEPPERLDPDEIAEHQHVERDLEP